MLLQKLVPQSEIVVDVRLGLGEFSSLHKLLSLGGLMFQSSAISFLNTLSTSS